MYNKVIIADTSCLIALKDINNLKLLNLVYEKITITPEIKTEFGESLPEWIIVEEVSDKKKISLLPLKKNEIEPAYHRQA